jgi:ribosomal protein S18 acetylase RimI-like enzyme
MAIVRRKDLRWIYASLIVKENEMELKVVTEYDKEFVMSIDKHVDDVAYASRVYTKSGYVIWVGDERAGIISHCILWDNLPFMNLLFVKEEYRHKGYAKQAIISWENEMKKRGYKMTLISTQVDEGAQHLYRKLGYVDCGGLVFHNTPFDQPMEMFFRKVL